MIISLFFFAVKIEKNSQQTRIQNPELAIEFGYFNENSDQAAVPFLQVQSLFKNILFLKLVIY